MRVEAKSQAPELSEINRKLHERLDRMTMECGQERPADCKDVAALLSALMQAGAGLRSKARPAPGTDPELDRELDVYRRNVERLRALLPSIHGRLLAERARIEAQRSRVGSVTEWAGTLRQTV
jgi:hypothetical protein